MPEAKLTLPNELANTLQKDLVLHHVMKTDWTEVLFVDHPQVFLPWKKAMREQAKIDASNLQIVFERFRVRKGARILDQGCERYTDPG